MPRLASDVRWTWVFATVLILVVLVVIGFLLGITSALNSIDDALGEADASVTDIRGDARPLPDLVQEINGNLTKIDSSLKPIPGQATSILSSLTSINGSLGRINGSLGVTSGSLSDTSGSLVNTSNTLTGISGSLVDTAGSLVDTSGSLRGTSGVLGGITSSLRDTDSVLVNVRGLASRIAAELIAAERRGSLGTAEIAPRVGRINGALGPAEADATTILGGLRDVNSHLTSICRSNALNLAVPGAVTPSAKC